MRDRLLHPFAVCKDERKVVFSCHHNCCEKNANEERLYNGDNDAIFCGSGMSRPEFVRDPNAVDRVTLNSMGVQKGSLIGAGVSLTNKGIEASYLIAAFIPMNNMPTQPLTFMLKQACKIL